MVDLDFDREAELKNAIAALIRDEIRRNPQNIDRFQDPAVYVTIQGEDPSPEFLKRFDGAKFPVKKGSEYPTEKAKKHGVGVIYQIKSWEWTTNDQLKIVFSFRCGLQCGGTNEFYLVRMKNSGWVIKEREWIEVE